MEEERIQGYCPWRETWCDPGRDMMVIYRKYWNEGGLIYTHTHTQTECLYVGKREAGRGNNRVKQGTAMQRRSEGRRREEERRREGNG